LYGSRSMQNSAVCRGLPSKYATAQLLPQSNASSRAEGGGLRPQPASRAHTQSAAATVDQRPTGGSIEGWRDGALLALGVGVVLTRLAHVPSGALVLERCHEHPSVER
jgi:hypothetical protein